MLSCKLLCFSTAFCKSYEYLVLDNTCDFYSTPTVESFYNALIEEIRNRSKADFNLLHLLRGNILSVLQENMSMSNKMLLVDSKPIAHPECEHRQDLSSGEIHCNDQLFDFSDNYLFRGVVPGYTYQFKLQVSSAFGLSDNYITKQIESNYIFC